MGRRELHTVLNHLRHVAGSPDADDLTDRQLLHRFARQRDEAAFAALVRRHASLVLGVCRRTLPNTQDVEDVFQATFLVLARKSASIRWRESIGGWLYEVAHRLAVKSCAAATRRHIHEKQAGIPTPLETRPEGSLQELCTVLDEELRRLPERYRQPLLLCYLEGQTRDQAARQLGLSLRTLHRRLERGLGLLRTRLIGRGITLSAALLAAGLSQKAASAATSALLLAVTARAAMRDTTKEGVTLAVAALVEGGLKSMSAARTKLAAGVLLALSCVVGAGVLAHQTRSAEQPQPVPEAPKAVSTSAVQPRADREGVPLPPGAIARLGTTRLRPMASELAFRDDRTLVTCGTNCVVRFWDVATGTVRKVQPLPGGSSNRVILSRDGKRLARMEAEGTMGVSVWDVDSGKRLHQLPYEAGQFFLQGAFSPDGRMLATADFSGMHAIRLWDLTTGKGKLLGKTNDRLFLMAFSPDSKRLVLALDVTLVCWDVTDGKELWKRTQVPRGMGFSPDGRILAVGDPRDPAHVRLIDAATGKSLDEHKFPGIRGVYRVQFSPDGKTLAIGMEKGIALWDLATGKQRHFLDRASFTFAFAPSGKSLVSLGGVLQRWDVATGKPLYEDTSKLGHTNTVHLISWSPDGQRLASMEGGNDSSVYVWSVWEGRLLRTLPPQSGSEWPGWRFTAFTPDGKYLVCGSDHILRVTDAATGRPIREWPTFDPVGKKDLGWLTNGRLSRDGKTMTAITQDFSAGQPTWLKTWDVETGERRLSRSLGLRGPSQAVIAPDGNSILSNPGVLYDVKADKVRYQLATEGPTRIGNGHPFVFSPEGDSIIAELLQDVPIGQGFPEVKGIQFWETATGKPGRRLPVREFCQSAFSPDGRFLATLSDEAIRLWEIVSGKEMFHLSIPGRQVGMWSYGRNPMAFAPDGRSLAVGLQDTTIVIWDMMPAAREASRPLSADQQDRLWAALASDDGTEAYKAIGRLIARPAETLPLLRSRLHPAAPPTERVRRLLKDLDSADFAKREAASRELAKLGERAESALREALGGKPSLELRRRIEHLLSLLTPEFVRARGRSAASAPFASWSKSALGRRGRS